MKILFKSVAGAAFMLSAAAALLWFLNTRDESGASVPEVAPAVQTTGQSTAERGAYLARAGNCMGCHTARGGAAYAGGRAIETPFGSVFTSNLTPEKKTGIGDWSSSDFWRALHNGRSRDGHLLYPAFPYPNYTQVTRQDSDTLFAYLQTVPPIDQPNRTHALQFPFQSQLALAFWRALFFRPGQFEARAGQSLEWNRGAYLVGGLGHCNACHSARNALGAPGGVDLAGGLIPVQNWYAPSLVSANEAGVGQWELGDTVSLLKTGISQHASVSGPMAEVVQGGAQYLSEADLTAMAVYLKELPAHSGSGQGRPDPAVMATAAPARPGNVTGNDAVNAAQLYRQHCAQCHGDDGKGVPNAYPALAGNRAVVMPQMVNLVQIVLNGGYAPATAGNPRPFGMPPFVLVLGDSEIAAVLTHIRSSWGNQAGPVSALEVNRIRANSGR
jgi:mono/diheme cytochrome c family protein